MGLPVCVNSVSEASMVLDSDSSHGTGFREDYANPAADPLAHTHEDFPFEEVFADLDGERTPDGDRAAEAMRQLMAWVVGGRTTQAHIAARALVMTWTTRPESLGGKSLSQLARDVGISSDVMHRTSADFSRTFGVRNPGQRHAWNFKAGKATPAA
jgi:hypothetical protein